MRPRRSTGSGGSGSDSDSRSAGKGGDGRVRRRDGRGRRSLIGTAWYLTKQVFFSLVHIYKSLSAFWSQMHVCMLPALGELDHQEELDAQQQQQQLEEESKREAAPGSPQRKPVSKEL